MTLTFKAFFIWNLKIFYFCYHPLIFSVSVHWLIPKIISLCDINPIMTLPIKKITSVLKDSTNIIANITTCPIRLAAILEIMPVSTIITAIILYLTSMLITVFSKNWINIKEIRNWKYTWKSDLDENIFN